MNWTQEFAAQVVGRHNKKIEDTLWDSMTSIEKFIAKKFPRWLAKSLLNYSITHEKDTWGASIYRGRQLIAYVPGPIELFYGGGTVVDPNNSHITHENIG